MSLCSVLVRGSGGMLHFLLPGLVLVVFKGLRRVL